MNGVEEGMATPVSSPLASFVLVLTRVQVEEENVDGLFVVDQSSPNKEHSPEGEVGQSQQSGQSADEPRTPQSVNTHLPTTPVGQTARLSISPIKTPLKPQEQVAEFLQKKGKDGTPLNEMEIAGILSLLNKNSGGELFGDHHDYRNLQSLSRNFRARAFPLFKQSFHTCAIAASF